MHSSNAVHESAATIMFAVAMFWMSLYPERSTSSYAISASRSAFLRVLSSSFFSHLWSRCQQKNESRWWVHWISSIKLHVWCCRWTIDTKYYTADACIWTLDSDGSNAENITEAVFKNCQALCMVFDLSDVRNFSSFNLIFRDVVGAVYITNFYRVQALPLHYKHT